VYIVGQKQKYLEITLNQAFAQTHTLTFSLTHSNFESVKHNTVTQSTDKP